MDHSGLQIIRKPVQQQTPAIERVTFSQFMNYCEQNGWQTQFTRSSSIIEKVKVDTTTRQLEYKIRTNDKSSHTTSSTAVIAQTDYSVMDKSDLVKFMRRNNVDFEAGTVTGGGTKATATTSTTQKSTDGIATLALLFAAYKLFYAQSSSSPLGGGMLSSKDSIGKLAKKNNKSSSSSSDVTTSFDDIHGIDNAKHDVMELVDSLRYPEKYRLVGARAPKGILLEGPPGCGKTTLARACANLADVPLIYCSGSDFVETYVGKGAARIRQLFAQARSITKTKGSSSCLIFIDEIDAIGKARSNGGSGNISNGSSDEAEQTLNALLTQMDGLGANDDGIFVLAATNRRELLDPALVRSGRFDRLIKVELPNSHGRYEVLRSHARKLPGFMEGDGIDIDRPNSLGVGKTIDLNAVAAVTDGCSGADLEQIVNEAAIRTVRRVSDQLKDGVSRDEVDVTILPEDMEESVNSFFQSREKPHRQSTLNLTPWGT